MYKLKITKVFTSLRISAYTENLYMGNILFYSQSNPNIFWWSQLPACHTVLVDSIESYNSFYKKDLYSVNLGKAQELIFNILILFSIDHDFLFNL